MPSKTRVVLIITFSVVLVGVGLTLGLVYGLRKEEEGEETRVYIHKHTSAVAMTVRKNNTEHNYTAHIIRSYDDEGVCHEVINLQYNETRYYKQNDSEWALLPKKKMNTTQNLTDEDVEEIEKDKEEFKPYVEEIEQFIDKLVSGEIKLRRELVEMGIEPPEIEINFGFIGFSGQPLIGEVQNYKLYFAYNCHHEEYDEVYGINVCCSVCSGCVCWKTCYPIILWKKHRHYKDCLECPKGKCISLIKGCKRRSGIPCFKCMVPEVNSVGTPCTTEYVGNGYNIPSVCTECIEPIPDTFSDEGNVTQGLNVTDYEGYNVTNSTYANNTGDFNISSNNDGIQLNISQYYLTWDQ
eukprot:TRINITY_DN3022_c0_g1_i1.p2 TRINITY_DN3022_c0_g1~~TRINITY_DN3022_c0_g1_i1.p2  ORF type:complete len:352 (+),score=31.51 TRINITY_DN3022_c0_g1_i1:1445-2500(+)